MGAIDEFRWHQEQGIYRGVTGANSRFPNKDGLPIAFTPLPKKGTIPIAKDMTGTLTSTGVSIAGVGTKFMTDLTIGDYLFDNNAAVRKIKSIDSDTFLTLEDAFPVDVSGVAVLRCRMQTFKMVQVWSSGSAAAILQESPLGPGQYFHSGGSPIAYDASASNAEISFTVSK